MCIPHIICSENHSDLSYSINNLYAFGNFQTPFNYYEQICESTNILASVETFLLNFYIYIFFGLAFETVYPLILSLPRSNSKNDHIIETHITAILVGKKINK